MRSTSLITRGRRSSRHTLPEADARRARPPRRPSWTIELTAGAGRGRAADAVGEPGRDVVGRSVRARRGGSHPRIHAVVDGVTGRAGLLHERVGENLWDVDRRRFLGRRAAARRPDGCRRSSCAGSSPSAGMSSGLCASARSGELENVAAMSASISGRRSRPAPAHRGSGAPRGRTVGTRRGTPRRASRRSRWPH